MKFTQYKCIIIQSFNNMNAKINSIATIRVIITLLNKTIKYETNINLKSKQFIKILSVCGIVHVLHT